MLEELDYVFAVPTSTFLKYQTRKGSALLHLEMGLVPSISSSEAGLSNRQCAGGEE